MPINCLFVFLSGFFVSIAFIILFKKPALKYKLLNSRGIPLIGGISINLSFIIASISAFIIFGNLYHPAIGIIISSIIMLVFGLIDDYRELSILTKFLVQIIATSLLILFGIRTYIVYVGEPLNIIITFIWVIGITNAFNHLDVMDGLAAGTAEIVSLSFFIISLLNGDMRTAILALGLAGSILGFLIFNLSPAKIYMGNSGSHFLGFTLAAIALVISYAPLERKIALFSPLLILGLPIFDTLFLIFVRIAKKKLPFKKSNDHIALRFLKLGHSKNMTLLFMLLLCLFFALCGILLSQVPNSLGTLIITVVIFLGLSITYRINRVSIDG